MPLLRGNCPRCGSRIDYAKRKIHKCYNEIDRSEDLVRPEISYQTPAKKPGGMCGYCGGMNPDCKKCGGSGVLR